MAASPARAPARPPSTAEIDARAKEAREAVARLGRREFLDQLATLGRAFAADPGNPGSYACKDCERCANCMFCRDCVGCYQCTHCVACDGCSNCSHCVESKGCQSSAYLLQSENCTHRDLVMCRNPPINYAWLRRLSKRTSTSSTWPSPGKYFEITARLRKELGLPA
jgi:hypothetical protein